VGVPDRQQQEARDAIGALLARARPKLNRILCRYRIPLQDAEDLVQEAFLALVTSWSSVRDPEGWLIGVLRFRCANYWRRRSRDLCEFVDDALLEALAGPQSSPSQDVELRQDVGKVVAHLPSRCQNLFQLRYRLGCTPGETAEKLRFRRTSISNIFSRCLTALTRRLMAVGFLEGAPHG
jgi:RNA polymerase sigma factor (sigma-70 family)